MQNFTQSATAVGVEPPKKKSVNDDEFGEIFGIRPDNSNYNAWKRVALILELKIIPSRVEDLKEAISESIEDMDWKDVRELFNIYTIKNSKPARKKEGLEASKDLKKAAEKEDSHRTKALETKVQEMDSVLKKLLALTEGMAQRKREAPAKEVEEEEENDAKEIYFMEEDEQFEIGSEVMALCVPKGSFFSGMQSLDFKERKEMVERYEIPRGFPKKAPIVDATWSALLSGGASPRDKELKNIAQQLLETTYPLASLLDFLGENLPGEPSAYWTRMVKDIFSLITFTQNYIHQLRKENVIRATAGQSAVAITKKRKQAESLMEDSVAKDIKSWSKTQTALRSYRANIHPFRGRGGFGGRSRPPRSSYSSGYKRGWRSRFRGRNRDRDGSSRGQREAPRKE
jgi:hypothetical protein